MKSTIYEDGCWKRSWTLETCRTKKVRTDFLNENETFKASNLTMSYQS